MKPTTKMFIAIALIVLLFVGLEMLASNYYITRFSAGH